MFSEKRSETGSADLAFRDVVDGCMDDSVGGFPIRIFYNQKMGSFEFGSRYGIFTPGPITAKLGEPIPFYTNVQDGNYSSFITPISIEEFLLVIEQMSSKILYSRDKRFDNEANNDSLFGLMLPLELNYYDNQWYIGKKE